MKNRLLKAGICMVAFTAFAFAQSGIAGKWVGETQGRGGTQTITLELQVDGSTLTGTIAQGQQGPVAISDGKVDGTKISFNQVLNFNGMEITVNWSGEHSGDELMLTRAGGRGGRGGRGGGGGPITFKRAS